MHTEKAPLQLALSCIVPPDSTLAYPSVCEDPCWSGWAFLPLPRQRSEEPKRQTAESAAVSHTEPCAVTGTKPVAGRSGESSRNRAALSLLYWVPENAEDAAHPRPALWEWWM